MHSPSTRWRFALSAAALSCALAPALAAPTVAYENLPTNLDGTTMESHHGTGGPILADDFVATIGGKVERAEWWGTAATSKNWELAFHTDDPSLHQPNIDDPFEGAFLKIGESGDLIVTGVADDPNHPDIFHYTANIQGPTIVAGKEYWFTAANFDAGWQWAQALGGPTVGSEAYNAHGSTGIGLCQDGGPHCGPWTDIHTDTAFRLAVPEPGSLALIGLAGLMLGMTRRRAGERAAATLPAAA